MTLVFRDVDTAPLIIKLFSLLLKAPHWSQLRTVRMILCSLLQFITLTELTIQRNKERFWQLEQTAKPKKANISLLYKSSSKGKTVLQNWHLRCPNKLCPALAPRAGQLPWPVDAVNSNLPVHSLQIERREHKANKEKYCDYDKATSTSSGGAHTQLAAAYYSPSENGPLGTVHCTWVCLCITAGVLCTQLLRVYIIEFTLDSVVCPGEAKALCL